MRRRHGGDLRSRVYGVGSSGGATKGNRCDAPRQRDGGINSCCASVANKEVSTSDGDGGATCRRTGRYWTHRGDGWSYANNRDVLRDLRRCRVVGVAGLISGDGAGARCNACDGGASDGAHSWGLAGEGDREARGGRGANSSSAANYYAWRLAKSDSLASWDEK